MESLQDRVKRLEIEKEQLQEKSEVKTWAELYEVARPAMDSKLSFKEYKKSAHPRTFSEMFGENSQDRLKESGTFNDIYKGHLREDVDGVSQEEAENEQLTEGRMKDMLFDYIESHLADDFCEKIGCNPEDVEDMDYGDMARELGFDDEFEYASHHVLEESRNKFSGMKKQLNEKKLKEMAASSEWMDDEYEENINQKLHNDIEDVLGSHGIDIEPYLRKWEAEGEKDEAERFVKFLTKKTGKLGIYKYKNQENSRFDQLVDLCMQLLDG